MFRVALSDLQGKTGLDWLPEEVARHPRENDLAVRSTGRTVELRETMPTPDSPARHWQVLKFPFTNGEGQRFVVGVAVDITGRR